MNSGAVLDTSQRRANVFLQDVKTEFDEASGKHARLNSLHEAYAVILEEMDELWEQVRLKRQHRDAVAIRDELVQIAAMATRTAVDLSYA